MCGLVQSCFCLSPSPAAPSVAQHVACVQRHALSREVSSPVSCPISAITDKQCESQVASHVLSRHPQVKMDRVYAMAGMGEPPVFAMQVPLVHSCCACILLPFEWAACRLSRACSAGGCLSAAGAEGRPDDWPLADAVMRGHRPHTSSGVCECMRQSGVPNSRVCVETFLLCGGCEGLQRVKWWLCGVCEGLQQVKWCRCVVCCTLLVPFSKFLLPPELGAHHRLHPSVPAAQTG